MVSCDSPVTSLLHDPSFLMLSKLYAEDMEKFNEAFSQAWKQFISAGTVVSRAKKCKHPKTVIV